MKNYAMPFLLLLSLGCSSPAPRTPAMERVEVAPDGKGFRLAPSGKAFTPWGLNYDRDDALRLLEDYWEIEWAKVEEDFREMKDLGATVVRIHLQFARFMKGPEEPDGRSLDRLGRLLALAEETGLYLDLTGLGCYRKSEVPAWYDRASEEDRWAMQARFWEAVAAVGARSPAVFCYNLMNEPVSPAGEAKEWLAGEMSGFSYVEVLSRSRGNRTRVQLAREWMGTLLPGIRRHDPKRPVTVGMFFIFDVAGGLSLGESPRDLARDLDYLSVHLYPKGPDVARTIELLRALAVGKPIVIEEMFPLNCPMTAFRKFVADSKGIASGWIGFYWGKTLEECRSSKEIKDALMAEWLTFFRDESPKRP